MSSSLLFSSLQSFQPFEKPPTQKTVAPLGEYIILACKVTKTFREYIDLLCFYTSFNKSIQRACVFCQPYHEMMGQVVKQRIGMNPTSCP